MDEVIIRKAVQEDCGPMLELIKELAAYEKALHEVTLTLDQFIEDGFGKSPVWGAFVAEYNAEIIGISLYYDRYSTWKGRRLYLEDLVVTETCRGKQVGKNCLKRPWNTAGLNSTAEWFFRYSIGMNLRLISIENTARNLMMSGLMCLLNLIRI